jgi:flagellar biosynthesis protein FlhF
MTKENGAAKEWQPISGPMPKGGASRFKSYYAMTVEEALLKAREEMGPDGILLQSRKTPLELRHLGTYEAVFAHPGRGATDLPAASAPPSDARLEAELAALRRQMQEIRHALAGRAAGPAAADVAGTAQRLALARLGEIGIADEIAQPIVESASVALGQLVSYASPVADASQVSPSDVDAILRVELQKRLRVAPPSYERGDRAPIVAVFGPPGVGKTAVLVKLAVERSKAAKRPIQFLSADCCRIGAAEQLRTYASILGAGIDFVDSPRLMAQAIEANLHREMILIDTPGLSGEDFELLNDLAEYLGRRPEIEKHLVLPATMRFRDMGRCLRRYEMFRADCLLFTHLDETDCFGPLYSAAVWCGRPLSFLTAGQQIPEDLEAAKVDRVMDLLFRDESGHTGVRDAKSGRRKWI